jgi:hypothetical protein
MVFKTQRFVLDINEEEQISVDPGNYTVRVYLPNGNVVAESVSVSTDDCRVDFDLLGVRTDEYARESLVGVIPRLPSADRAEALQRYSDSVKKGGEIVQVEPKPGSIKTRKFQFYPSAEDVENLSSRLRQAATDVGLNRASIERVGSKHALTTVRADLWQPLDGAVRVIGETTPYAGETLGLRNRDDYASRDLQALGAWIGNAAGGLRPFTFQSIGEVDARLVVPDSNFDVRFLSGERRSFATVIDGAGDAHVLVFPHCWRRYAGEVTGASLVVALGIDTILREESDVGERAGWQCSTVVDDSAFNAYMGFLSRGMGEAADVVLGQASNYLFEKTQNPVAAAAGAFGLLSQASRSEPDPMPWRRWIENLYTRSPELPDGAVAMARMYWQYGAAESDEAGGLDVEVLRRYALEAVRRGLPYLRMSIEYLSEILTVVVSDDRMNDRSTDDAKSSAQALQRVSRLSRLVVPGEFFTTVRLRTRKRSDG